MQNYLLIAHVVIGAVFIFTVLLQDRGVGFGTAVGGAGGAGFYATQRGAAKVLHYITVFLAVAFLVTAVVYVLVPASPSTQDPTSSISSNDVIPIGGDEPVEIEVE